jgi:hypothetical protein
VRCLPRLNLSAFGSPGRIHGLCWRRYDARRRIRTSGRLTATSQACRRPRPDRCLQVCYLRRASAGDCPVTVKPRQRAERYLRAVQQKKYAVYHFDRAAHTHKCSEMSFGRHSACWHLSAAITPYTSGGRSEEASHSYISCSIQHRFHHCLRTVQQQHVRWLFRYGSVEQQVR